MNAPQFLREDRLPPQPFIDATERVNAWRGRCLDAFARAEQASTECLFFLAQVSERGTCIRLPYLTGQRFEALAAAFAADAPFAVEGKTVLPVIKQVQAHLHLRTMLCHGLGRVTLDRNGGWTLVLRVSTLRAKQIARDSLVLAELEAEQVRDDLARSSQRLCTLLGQVKANLTR